MSAHLMKIIKFESICYHCSDSNSYPDAVRTRIANALEFYSCVPVVSCDLHDMFVFLLFKVSFIKRITNEFQLQINKLAS